VSRNQEKISEHRQHAKHMSPKGVHLAGRDYHSPKEKEIRTVREGAKSKHPENKRRV
jgi:hypothetical protein